MQNAKLFFNSYLLTAIYAPYCRVSFSIPIRICGCSYCGRVSFSNRGGGAKRAHQSNKNTKGSPFGKPFVLGETPKYIVAVLLFHKLCYLVVWKNCLLENVSTGLLRLNHLDALGKLLTYTCSKGCDCFLCHNSLPPIT